MSAAVVANNHHEEGLASSPIHDEKAPIIEKTEKEEVVTVNSPTKSPKKDSKKLDKSAKKQHLEQRHRRHFIWNSINFFLFAGRVLSKFGVKHAQPKPLRRSARWSGGLVRSTANGVSHAKTSIAGVKIRVYRHVKAEGRQPVCIFIHGGGWVICSARSYHPFALDLCKRSGITIVTVDYRLAPEHPYPAAIDDCLAVTKAILDEDNVGPELEGKIDTSKVIVGGDSAGGNLSAVVALDLIRSGDTRLHGLMLICPVLQALDQELESYRKFNFKYANVGLSWFLAQYAGIEPSEGLLKVIDQGKHVGEEAKQNFTKYIIPPTDNTEGANSVPDSGCQTASSSLPSPVASNDQNREEASKQGPEGEETKEEVKESMPKDGGPLVVTVTSMAEHEEDHIETEQLIDKKKEKKVEKETVEIPEQLTALATNIRAWPLLADDTELAKMPITMIQGCSNDPLLDEGKIFYERLQHAGVKDARYFLLPRAQHCEVTIKHLIGSKAAKDGFQQCVNFLRDITAKPEVVLEITPDNIGSEPSKESEKLEEGAEDKEITPDSKTEEEKNE